MTKGTKRLIFLALGGILTALTLIFPSLGFLEWLTLVPAALVLLKMSDESRYRVLWGYGFFFFLCFYLVLYHWFLMLYPLDFVEGISKAEALFVTSLAWIGISVFQALGGGFVFLVFGAVSRHGFAKKYPISKPFFVAAIWAVFEWAQTLFWIGLPWGRLALGQSKLLIELQSASLFGSYFISFLLVVVNFLLAYAILMPKKVKLCVVLCVSLILSNTIFGTIAFLCNTPENDTIKIAAVQGNVNTNEKWDLENVERVCEVYRKYTLSAANDGADIILWPETAVPLELAEDSYLARFLRPLAKESGATLLVGAFTVSEDKNYNSMVAVYPDGSIDKNIYSKRHLVPFGEYLPMENLVRTFFAPLASLMRADILTAGEGTDIFSIEGTSIGTLICFDSIYEELALESVCDGAEILTVSTNDAWFLDSAALDMHNAQSQLRAIENNRYVVRAANTGISSIINDRGELVCVLDPLTEGYLVSEIEINTHRTLYSYIGNTFVYVCALAILLDIVYEKYLGFSRKTVDKKRK